MISTGIVLALTAGTAGAVPATVTMGTVSGVSYQTAHLTGTVDLHGQEGNWRFEVSTDETNWQHDLGEYYVFPGTGPIEVELDPTLKPGTHYFARLHALTGSGEEPFTDYFSPPPYVEFTTPSVEKPTVLTVDDATDVTNRTAKVSGSAERPNDPDPAFDTSCQFEYVTAAQFATSGFASSQAAGCDKHPAVEATAVKAELTGLEQNTTYHLRLSASNAGGPNFLEAASTFTTSAVIRAQTLYAERQRTSALLAARINPANSPVTYQFEWGATDSYGSVAPAAPSSLSAADEAFHVVTAPIVGLQPASTYHYRVIATNTQTDDTVKGADSTFSTLSPAPPPVSCPNEAFRIGLSATLPDCRAYEFVTPGLNNANLAVPETKGVAHADGNEVLFSAADAPPSAESSSTGNKIVATRGPGGWSTRSLEPRLAGVVAGFAPFYTMGVSADFTQTVVESFLPVVGASETPGRNWYLTKADGAGVRLTNVGGPTEIGRFVGASKDFSHLFFVLPFKQNESDPPVDENHSPVYEWTGGQIRLVAIEPGPDQTPFPGGSALESPEGVGLLQVSDDGERVLFSAGGSLYLRIGGKETVAVAASQRAGDVNPPGQAAPIGITDDGSEVLFISSGRLTDDANENGADLYSYDVDSGDLTDLTVDTDPGDAKTGAAVKEVLAVNRAGSYVYFIARGNLAPGAQSGELNIYVEHGGEIKFVAAGGDKDYKQAGGDNNKHLTSYVTPDGRHLAFSARAQITAYDNATALEPQPEIYKYTYGGTVECASCRPDGSRPQGQVTFPAPYNFGTGLERRLLSDDGRRLFFQSTDALAPGALPGMLHVYEYVDGEVHLLSPGDSVASLVDASASGDDVFIASNEQLMSGDEASVPAIYDARVGAEVAKPPVLCGGESCRNAASAAPGAASPGSASFEAPGEFIAPKKVAAKAKKLKLRVSVPESGELTVSGKGLKSATKKVSKAGPVTIALTLKPAANRTRLRTGVFETKAQVLFKPRSGSDSRSSGGRPVVSLRFEGPSKKGGK